MLPGAAAPADSGCTLTCNMPTGEGRTQRVPRLPSARPCPEGVEQARLCSEALGSPTRAHPSSLCWKPNPEDLLSLQAPFPTFYWATT